MKGVVKKNKENITMYWFFKAKYDKHLLLHICQRVWNCIGLGDLSDNHITKYKMKGSINQNQRS